MKSIEKTKNRQKKIERKKCKRKEIAKLIKINKNKGKSITYQMIQTISHFFPDLFDRVRQIEECRKKTSDYELAELIIAGIAMFLFKEGSRNAFNNDRQEEHFSKNYKKIFKMRLPHMDTADAVMRVLKENELEELKTSMVRNLLEKKSLHKFRFLKRWFVIAVDGSGILSFSEKHCDHCTHKTSKNGKTTYFHNVLEAKLICCNGFSISVATEWIENYESEYEKQDCEQKAFKRLEKRLKKLYPRLPVCITADGLYPNEPFFNLCKNNNWSFIVTFEDGNLPSVWKQVEQLKLTTDNNKYSQFIEVNGKKIQHHYCWINGIGYRGNHLNYIDCEETSEKKFLTLYI